jgi:hypothetical protein
LAVLTENRSIQALQESFMLMSIPRVERRSLDLWLFPYLILMKVDLTEITPRKYGFLTPRLGGQLRVSHNGHSTSFDWSNDSNTVQWAAFYSDCEHEVLEVKSGHRITLTYNLYVTEHIGGVIQCFPTADAALSPLYEGAKQMLEQPGFMKNGKATMSNRTSP